MKMVEQMVEQELRYIGSRQAEALYAFMAWLTCREERSGPFSSRDNAAQGVELVVKFCGSQGWDIIPERDDCNNKDNLWVEDLKPYPKD